MKVLVVYHFIAKYREAVFQELLEHDDFYFFSDVKTKTDIKLINTTFYNNKNFIKGDNFYLPLGFLWQKGLLSEIRKGRYTHVIFLGDPYFLSTWVALLLSKFLNIKTYLWTHGFINRSGFFLDSIKKIMYRISDGLMLYGNQSKQDLILAGYPDNKLHVIYNSLDYDYQKQFREKLKIKNPAEERAKFFNNAEAKPLIFIGRLTYHKKLDMLIRALALITKRGIADYKIIFVGDGEARESLEALVSNMGLNEDVLFYGSCHNEAELASLLNMSVACVSPGEIGLTAMHSAAYGVPIITHNNRLKQMPEYEVVIDSYSGYLFDYNSVESLADAITKVDHSSKETLGKNAISLIEKYYTAKTQALLIKGALENE